MYLPVHSMTYCKNVSVPFDQSAMYFGICMSIKSDGSISISASSPEGSENIHPPLLVLGLTETSISLIRSLDVFMYLLPQTPPPPWAWLLRLFGFFYSNDFFSTFVLGFEVRLAFLSLVLVSELYGFSGKGHRFFEFCNRSIPPRNSIISFIGRDVLELKTKYHFLKIVLTKTLKICRPLV